MGNNPLLDERQFEKYKSLSIFFRAYKSDVRKYTNIHVFEVFINGKRLIHVCIIFGIAHTIKATPGSEKNSFLTIFQMKSDKLLLVHFSTRTFCQFLIQLLFFAGRYSRTCS